MLKKTVQLHSQQKIMTDIVDINSRSYIFLEENKEMETVIINGVTYFLSEVINDNYRAINGQFLKKTWRDGMKKEYFDISRVMAINIKNGTDIDTKNIGVESENQAGIGAVGLLREVIKNHLKVQDYATLFNDVRDELVDFGHVMLKKTSRGTQRVDLRNIIRPAHILEVQDSEVMELHYYSYNQMLARKNQWKNWEQVEEIWERMKLQGLNTFKVYEHWMIDDFDGQVTKGVVTTLDAEIMDPKDSEDQDRGNWTPLIELDRMKTPYTRPIYDKKEKESLEKQGFLIDGERPLYPYQDIRFVTVKGRWLGAGVYEITAPLRRAYNRTMNVKLRYDEVQTKGTFLHTKGMRGQNLTQTAIQALESTGVVDLAQGAKLEQMKIQSLTADFINSADKFFEFARQLLGLTAQGTGEDLPANMPATTAAINAQRAKTLFDQVLEIQGIAWKNWFSNFELEDIMENLTSKQWVKIQGSEEDLVEVLTPFAENYLKMDTRFDNALFLAEELGVRDAIEPGVKKIKQELVKKNILNDATAFVQLKKKIVDNADFFIEFYITNEAFDKQTRITELATLKQDALTNPASSISPKKIEAEILNNLDLDPKRFLKDDEEKEVINNPQLNANLPQAQGAPVAPQAPPAA